jgi:hypothetical protein
MNARIYKNNTGFVLVIDNNRPFLFSQQKAFYEKNLYFYTGEWKF